jgi:hypothetical protein
MGFREDLVYPPPRILPQARILPQKSETSSG